MRAQMRVHNAGYCRVVYRATSNAISLSHSFSLKWLGTINTRVDRSSDVDEGFRRWRYNCAGYFKSVCRGSMVAQWFRNDGYRSYTGGLIAITIASQTSFRTYAESFTSQTGAYRAYYNCTASITCPIYGTNHGHTRTARKCNMQYYCVPFGYDFPIIRSYRSQSRRAVR